MSSEQLKPTAMASKVTPVHTEIDAIISKETVASCFRHVADTLGDLASTLSPGDAEQISKWTTMFGKEKLEDHIFNAARDVQTTISILAISCRDSMIMDDIMSMISSISRDKVGFEVVKVHRNTPVPTIEQLTLYHPLPRVQEITLNILTAIICSMMHNHHEIIHKMKAKSNDLVPQEVMTAFSDKMSRAILNTKARVMSDANLVRGLEKFKTENTASSTRTALIDTFMADDLHTRLRSKAQTPVVDLYVNVVQALIVAVIDKMHAKDVFKVDEKLLSDNQKSSRINTDSDESDKSDHGGDEFGMTEELQLPYGVHVSIDQNRIQNLNLEKPTNAIQKSPKVDSVHLHKHLHDNHAEARIDKKISGDSNRAEGAGIDKEQPALKIGAANRNDFTIAEHPDEAAVKPAEQNTDGIAADASDRSKYTFRGLPISATMTPRVFDSLKTEILDKKWDRLPTSGFGNMCGLFAASKTLSNMLREIDPEHELGNAQAMSATMIDYFRSEAFQVGWFYAMKDPFPSGVKKIAGRDDDEQHTLECLSSLSNVGLQAISFCVHAFTEFRFSVAGNGLSVGVLSSREEEGRQVAVAYAADKTDKDRLVWIWSTQASGKFMDRTLNHYEGFGPKETK